MDEPLDTSKTAVESPEDEATSYFELRSLAHDHIGGSLDLHKLQSKLGSSSIKTGSKIDEDNISIHSNETIGNNVGDDRDDLMYSQDAHLHFPEGGKDAYLVIFGAFMILIFTFGFFNTLGVMQTYISENQLSNVNSTTISWIFSIVLFVNFFTLIFSGLYFDKNGSRRLIFAGWLLTASGLIATANATKVWHFILGFSILVGIGSGLTIAPAFGCVAQNFNRKRGFMTSIASTGGSIGGIIFPLMLRKLFEDIGFEWGMRICALLATFCYGLAFIFLKERFPKHQNDHLTKFQKVLSYRSAFDFRGLKDYKFLFVVFGCTLGECSIFITGTYLSSYARAQGKSLSTSYILLSVTQACGIPGRWITGFLSDRYGRFNVISLMLFLGAVIPFVTLLPFGDNTGAMFAFASFWGFFTGSIFPLLAVCCGQISKTEEFGKRYGTMYSIVAFGTLACFPIGGVIIGDGGTDRYLYCIVYYAGSMMLASGICYTISKLFAVKGNVFAKF